MLAIVIRPRGNVAGLDPDRRDAGVIKLDAEEGQASIARRSRNVTVEEKLAVLVEVLDQGAAVARRGRESSPAIWLVNICEHRAETSYCCRGSTIGARYGEERFGDVAPHRREQPRPAERPEDGAVGGIAKEHGQAALSPAGRRSLRKPQAGCFELAASGVQEHVERRHRSCGIHKVGVATVPVDLAPTLLDRAWIIAVAVPQGSAECIDCALNGRSVWSGSLEYQRRGLIGLCLCSLANCEPHQ